MTKHTKWNKELLEPIVRSSISYAECLNKMGLVPAGGNYKNLQKNIKIFNLDITHMKHQAHNQGLELKKLGKLSGKGAIRKRLIKTLGHKCQTCQLETWNGQPIPLEVEHISGNNRDNRVENLTLLCCNCHAQTPTWRNRKRT